MTQAKSTGSERDIGVARAASKPPLRQGDAAGLPVVLRSPQRLSMPARPTERRRGERHGWALRLRGSLASSASGEKDQGLAFLFLPVAMGAGAGLFYMSPTDPPLVLLAAGLAIALLVGVWTRQSQFGPARVSGFAAAMFAGALASSLEVHDGPVLLDSDVTTSIVGTVEAREFDADGRVRYLIRLVATSDPEIRRPPARVRLVARSPHEAVPIGAMISGRARLSSPSGPVLPGGYDYAFRAFVDGIGAHGYFYRAPEGAPGTGKPQSQSKGTASAIHAGFGSFSLGLRQIREKVSARIRSVLPGDPGGVAAALAVSDRRGISRPTVDALRATGLAHILAISGLHMALAAGTLYIAIRRGLAAFPVLVEAWPVKKFAAIGAMLTATAYLLISGGSVPTQRAWVMLSVMLIAVLADRPALTMRNVALAAMAIMLVSPSAVVGPGFQMSFAATAALISAYAAIARRARDTTNIAAGGTSRSAPLRWLAFVAKALFGLAVTSLVAGLATGLFSAHHFHRVAGNGLLANLLAMPLVTLVVMPAGLLAMLLMPFGLDAWPLHVMGQGLEGVIAVARYVEGLGGDFSVGQVPLQATMIAGAGFVVLVFLRSWLRLSGLALFGLGAVSAVPPFAHPAPDILIAESGDLVALAGPAGLASNAARPSAFVFSQWQVAMRGRSHLPPVNVAVPSKPAGGNARTQGQDDSEPDSAVPAAILDALLASAAGEPSRFHCAGRGLCAAIHSGAAIVAIADAAFIGAACDRADLVVVSIPVYMRSCRSGATLFTSRSLRRTGSMAIRIEAETGITATQAGPSPSSPPGPVFHIDAALDGVIRPWTIHRYYDWRTGTYDLPG